ncbi:DUF2243 domain-containing protein [Brevibacillus sedimenti]|nr:DUF2243 domain-containing protein [Anoxybacillus sediminis]
MVNHHLLQLHHVKPGAQQFLFDLSYDVVALLLLVTGWIVRRRTTSA